MFSKPFLPAFLLACLTVFSTLLAIEPPAQPPVDTAKLAPAIDKMVAELSSPTSLDVKAAEIKLSLLPNEAIPLLEAAAKKPGIPADALARLNKIIAREKEFLPARQHISAQRIADWQENLQSALAAYDKAGTKNPKWDADARKAIELFVSPPGRKEPGSAQAALEKAIDEGCNDPLVLYMEASGIPSMLIETHKRLARYSPSPQQYFALPVVWNDIESVYLPFLQAQPNSAAARSNYCALACQAGKWNLAKRQFDLLGDNADASAFGGAENLKRMRDTANQQTASPAVP